ncbi:phage-related protein [Paenibacillus turicensis]|uniref:Phage-related protein n=1 Tax=Paenibacillus turicensis TaxID=160487 RepID=A0ABS4FVT4_9BACL|nr:phage-related protein [Paenibacillus turicensis]
MTIRDALYFSYAGKKSVDFGITNVDLSSGMQEEALTYSRAINKVSTKGRDTPYFQSVEKDVLKFNVSFAFEDAFNERKLREVTRWLAGDYNYYQELYFTNELGQEPEKIYYALVVNDPVLIHNSLQQGYLTLTFECSSPYAYSPFISSPLYACRESKFERKDKQFTEGQIIVLKPTDSGSLTLPPHRAKWSDWTQTLSWQELEQQL